MRHPATSFLLVLAVALPAYGAVPYAKVREIGERVACQCGACAYTVGSCDMLNCEFSDPVLEQIREGLEAGKSEEAVLEEVYAKYGSETRVEPKAEGFGMVGWIAPFATFLCGLAAIPWILRRWRSNSLGVQRGDSVPDEVVDRYRSQIEDDLEALDQNLVIRHKASRCL